MYEPCYNAIILILLFQILERVPHFCLYLYQFQYFQANLLFVFEVQVVYCLYVKSYSASNFIYVDFNRSILIGVSFMFLMIYSKKYTKNKLIFWFIYLFIYLFFVFETEGELFMVCICGRAISSRLSIWFNVSNLTSSDF